ncbi:MAG TPA: LD-carboxypeptidase [Vicinamibacterales bacterium]|jgi:muramoyltetrapeptide carboxypeptidase|nr:LD-carboxypeptidase [Vicinamibacterales bacterium]
MLKPRALTPGDRLAVVAPASAFKREEFDRGVDEIRRLGFEPVYDDSVFARERYVAGSPEVRAAAISRAWNDPAIAGLIGVRGGYGSVQVLPLLDPEEARRARKPFVGYSDLTSVLTFLTNTCSLTAFHGPMLAGRLGRGPGNKVENVDNVGSAGGYDRRSFLSALTCREPMGELTAPALETLRAGEAGGLLLGGTITQLLASLGTPFAFSPPPGCVLFLDEVGERPYRLDRMVTQLRQSGILARAAAVVIGELPNCDEPSGNPTARAVMGDLFADFPGPVLIGFPSGHTTGPAMTLPLGVRCRVVGGAVPALVIEEAAVA